MQISSLPIFFCIQVTAFASAERPGTMNHRCSVNSWKWIFHQLHQASSTSPTWSNLMQLQTSTKQSNKTLGYNNHWDLTSAQKVTLGNCQGAELHPTEASMPAMWRALIDCWWGGWSSSNMGYEIMRWHEIWMIWCMIYIYIIYEIWHNITVIWDMTKGCEKNGRLLDVLASAKLSSFTEHALRTLAQLKPWRIHSSRTRSCNGGRVPAPLAASGPCDMSTGFGGMEVQRYMNRLCDTKPYQAADI